MRLLTSFLPRITAGLLTAALLVSCGTAGAAAQDTPAPAGENTETAARTAEATASPAQPAVPADPASAGDEVVYYPVPDLYVEGDKAIDGAFAQTAASLGFKLLNAGKGTDSRMVSPVSVLYALGLAANGAAGETRTQMEKALLGGAKISDFNGYFRYFREHQPASDKIKLNVANSMWINTLTRFTPSPDFLVNASNFFAADVLGLNYAAPASVGRINQWVSDKTDGMIEKIADKLDPASAMTLVNAVLFDGKWKQTYSDDQVRDRVFTAYDGTTETREFLNSSEDCWFRLGAGTGFLRPYDEQYSFVGILPDEGKDVFDYASTITGADFLKALGGATKTNGKVHVSMPSFSFDYSAELAGPLAELGMTLPFAENADFSAFGSGAENFFISSVLHKTRIELTREGTRAAAVTAITFGTTAFRPEEPIVITLDRPFVFAIVDNGTNLPVFCGVYCGD